jgi:AcrR family transcriptional regulator
VGTPARRSGSRWGGLNTARRALIEEGTAGLEIKKLAKRLCASRGGFYWFFTSRDQLLTELLAYWAQASTLPFEQILQSSGTNGQQEFQSIVNLWIDEKNTTPNGMPPSGTGHALRPPC